MSNYEKENKKLEKYKDMLVGYIKKEFNENPKIVFNDDPKNIMLTCMITSYNISFIISIKIGEDDTNLPVLSIFFNYILKPSFAAECILNLIKEKILTKFLILNVGDNGFTDDGNFIIGEKLEAYIINNMQSKIENEKALDDVMRFTNIDNIPSC